VDDYYMTWVCTGWTLVCEVVEAGADGPHVAAAAPAKQRRKIH
jgi:hypothetical protein